MVSWKKQWLEHKRQKKIKKISKAMSRGLEKASRDPDFITAVEALATGLLSERSFFRCLVNLDKIAEDINVYKDMEETRERSGVCV
jgi:hypothetical protein